MHKTILTTATILMAATTLLASTVEKRIPTLKVGKCAITILDRNGIKPLSGATLELKQADDGKTAVSAVANKSGLCEITVAEGRYVLSINAKPVTLINAAKDGELAWARIVLSDSPMMVGGQEGAEDGTASTFFGLSGKKLAIGGLLAAGAVGGGIAIYENNKDDDDDDDEGDQQPPPVQDDDRRYNAPPASL